MSAPPAYSDNPSGQAAPLPNKKTYGAAPTDSQATDPLLAAEAGTSRVAMQGRSGNAWMGGPSADDESDDFKLGVNVIDCDAEIRLAFIRKVYSILFVQVLATCAVSLAMYHPAVKQFMQAHGWIIWIPFGGSFMTLLLTYWKRHHFPANLVLLGLFTIFEAMMIGTVTSYTDGRIVSLSQQSKVSAHRYRSCKRCSSLWVSSSVSPCSPSRPRSVLRKTVTAGSPY